MPAERRAPAQKKSVKSVKSMESVLSDHLGRFEGARTRRDGSILFRLIGEESGDYFVNFTSTGCHVSREAGAGVPHFEVIGDARAIRRVLEGKRDGRLQFFAGGIRVRGDLRYLSDFAHEMGFIKKPFWRMEH